MLHLNDCKSRVFLQSIFLYFFKKYFSYISFFSLFDPPGPMVVNFYVWCPYVNPQKHAARLRTEPGGLLNSLDLLNLFFEDILVQKNFRFVLTDMQRS